MSDTVSTTTWQSLVADKQRRQQASIPKAWLINVPDTRVAPDITKVPDTCGILTSKEVEITNANVEILLPRLASGSWTAVEVTTAFYKRAIIAHQLTNCLTEIFVEKALARATELDDHLKATGKVVGPLHGLPISLKDQVNIEGVESCMGYVSWLGKHAQKNAVLVDILLAQGAVPLVKTNVPQTLMWAETFNHVFGRTLNPHNRNLTSGGSSGGEGALVALKGSAIGSYPLYLNIETYPQSAFTLQALVLTLEGRPPLPFVPDSDIDVLLTYVVPSESLLHCVVYTVFVPLVVEYLIDQQPWLKDPLVVRKRWSQEEHDLVEHGYGKSLCFATLWNDGLVTPHPPILRGLAMVKDALVSAGHQVIDWQPPVKHGEICETIRAIWDAGAQADYASATAPTGEPIIATMSPDQNESALKASFRPSGDAKATVNDLWQTQRRRRELREAYLAHWQQTINVTGTGRPVDAIISPVAPFTAPPHGKYTNANYTMVWNAMDYSAIVVPVCKADPTIDIKKPLDRFLSEQDKENYDLYVPEVFSNGPVSVQIVGRTLEEEAVIAMGEIVDDALKAAKVKVPAKM
ncbi:hypothetical protein ONZ45_g1362 [Pleurotus djamor]|nr:hypothetical protein ONZ45_g1362 [Pleurotus djamor]